MEGYLVLGALLIIFIVARISDYRDERDEEKRKALSGSVRRRKTPTGVILEIGYNKKNGIHCFRLPTN